MERNRKIEKEFIRRMAMHVQNESFIISSLRLMDTDELRINIIEYLKKHPTADRREIEGKMFYLAIR